MVEYFIRRLLLTIPTFLGSTFVVFLIVQLAPGGPLEQQIQALKRGGETAGAGLVGEQALPKDAIEELKRFYGFDKPIWQRYLIWLGVWKREAKSYRIKPGVPRLVGDNERLILVKEGESFVLRNAADPSRPIGDWKWRQERDEETGEVRYRVYREAYSGILTGDFGRSYRFRKPVIELIAERLPVSIQFGIISFVLSYAISVYLGVQKALRHNTPFDFATSSAVFMTYSIPGWAIGAVLLVLFATDRFFPIFPLGGFEDPLYADFSLLEKIWDRAWHFVLPTIAYTAGSFALLTMLMKNSLIETPAGLHPHCVREGYSRRACHLAPRNAQFDYSHHCKHRLRHWHLLRRLVSDRACLRHPRHRTALVRSARCARLSDRVCLYGHQRRCHAHWLDSVGFGIGPC